MELSARIERIWAAAECERIMSGHAFFHAAAHHREEMERFWTKGECTWAHCFGQFADRDTHINAYVVGQEETAKQIFEEASASYPELRDCKNMPDRRTVAEIPMHYVTSPVIEVAGNGKTARGMFYTPGLVFSILNPEKAKEGMWMWERYGCDFALEDGSWVFKNMKIGCDVEHGMEFPEWPLLPVPEDENDASCDTEGNFVEGPMFYFLTQTMLPQKIPYMALPYEDFSELKSYSVPSGGKYS